MERKVVQGITIDSEQTRDIDDAIWIEFQSDGWWHILVSIADVSEEIRHGTKMDSRAREMVVTKYFRSGNSPMLPRHFSEDQLSLWPGKPRKTVTVDLAIRFPEFAIQNVAIYPSTLTSLGRVTYDKIPGILERKEPSPEYDIVNMGCKMALSLLDRRRKAGAMVLYDLNNGWVTTEEGFLKQIEKKEETIGYILIQEMMVLANAQVAEYAVKNDIPVLFRNHMAMSAAPDRSILLQQMQDAITTPMADLEVVRQRTHLLMGRANYGDSLLGHYGLNLPAYLHFTSPIRRYADLITHRQIRAHLDDQPLPYTKEDIAKIAEHINDTIELDREQASVHFKTKDEEKAHRAIDARRLDGLDAVQFERVTKVEARSGSDPSDAFEEAFLRKLKEKRLPLISLTVIMTAEGLTEGWKPLQQAIVDQLVKQPEDAVSLLAQAQSIAQWPLTTFAVTHEGPDHARTFTATASHAWQSCGYDRRMADLALSGTGKAASAKLAKQVAAIALLARLTGSKMPERTINLPTAPPAAKAVPVVIDPAKDPVSALMEYVMKAKVPEPIWQFGKTGPDHVPVITCSCKLGDVVKTEQAGTKQEAKKKAAKAVLEEYAGRA